LESGHTALVTDEDGVHRLKVLVSTMKLRASWAVDELSRVPREGEWYVLGRGAMHLLRLGMRFVTVEDLSDLHLDEAWRAAHDPTRRGVGDACVPETLLADMRKRRGRFSLGGLPPALQKLFRDTLRLHDLASNAADTVEAKSVFSRCASLEREELGPRGLDYAPLRRRPYEGGAGVLVEPATSASAAAAASPATTSYVVVERLDKSMSGMVAQYQEAVKFDVQHRYVLDNVAVAGGAVAQAFRTGEALPVGADVDIFMMDVNPVQARQVLQSVVQMWARAIVADAESRGENPATFVVVLTNVALTFYAEGKPPVQVVLAPHASVEHLLCRFDLPAVQAAVRFETIVGYHGPEPEGVEYCFVKGKAVCMPSFVEAVASNTLVVPRFASEKTIPRILKHAVRFGSDIFLPGANAERISPEVRSRCVIVEGYAHAPFCPLPTNRAESPEPRTCKPRSLPTPPPSSASAPPPPSP
jgi:hypothetical protein